MERVWKFSEDSAMVERECLLFEAGDYPDKGVTVTAGDLKEIVLNSAEEIPVKIEHLAESPFDRVLGVVTGLRAIGSQLWGTLRQSKDAWDLMQRAGVRSLSVGLDITRKRIVETSLVCRPRVARAQVFHREDLRAGRERPETSLLRFKIGLERGEEIKMIQGVRRAAEGFRASVSQLLTDLKAVEEDAPTEGFADFAQEREAMARERAEFREGRVTQTLLDWKRAGLLRGNEMAEASARVLLLSGEGSVVQFGEGQVSVSDLFARFVEANGTVIPMGERIPASPERGEGGHGARARLVELAETRAQTEGVSLAVAFAATANAHPDLAQRAREE